MELKTQPHTVAQWKLNRDKHVDALWLFIASNNGDKCGWYVDLKSDFLGDNSEDNRVYF